MVSSNTASLLVDVTLTATTFLTLLEPAIVFI